jgi:hypothetical protein
MKFLRYVLVIVFCGLLVSCYEVNEDIVINEDGSGTYVTKMDMSQMIEMMQSFAGEEELSKGGLDRAIDTIISMKSIMDSDAKATPAQKELWKDGKMKLQMNIKEKIFKMDVNVPYKNFGNLQQLMSGDGSAMTGISSVFKNMFDKKDEPKDNHPIDQAVEPQKGPEMGDFSTIYDVTVKKGFISKKVNAEKFKALMDKPEMAQLKQMGTSGIEILYTTSFKLPNPAKNVSNPLLKLSADKKVITMKYNLLDMIDSPDKFSYTIEY